MPPEDEQSDTTTPIVTVSPPHNGNTSEECGTGSESITPTAQITISTGEAVVAMLTSLARTQLYGSDAPSVAEQLIRLKLMELVDQGKITTPPRSALPWEKSEEE
ncbi:hypothetical protein A2454_02085 [Candidatus Peribacteria bacterium RIFOXYC2_FULL_55_14]|nr:MAG: hypothetical protein UY87_C0038G0008 [Candidatus Peribacteria bacterium GW2011_GWC2_54_8]KKW44617.1 MAG: hypothetical protein UY90_C0006G0006 [Candidatus Peregrinibacteria bacterium GW2011_GWA2_54_9]OGJ72461.1 MAG: hypothetical protein A2198_06715 [Candidatus Peribacteria bacterium RIFOXYA1_FULL_56_14]OGJ73510.1 MAG: hypothetical protein A2217_02270 [Candidatus Peribacteria bacterium RIFOXYA2_FULL_55_28]OGJ74691.1 MAG: hypothetical protein A2384_03555 [Candidatus Peribacteria bacterium 